MIPGVRTKTRKTGKSVSFADIRPPRMNSRNPDSGDPGEKSLPLRRVKTWSGGIPKRDSSELMQQGKKRKTDTKTF